MTIDISFFVNEIARVTTENKRLEKQNYELRDLLDEADCPKIAELRMNDKHHIDRDCHWCIKRNKLLKQ